MTLLLGGLLLVPSGCGSKSDSSSTSTGPVDSASAELEPLPGLEPFDAPLLEELEASVEWVDRPVRDSMKLRREYDAAHPAPISVDGALKLKNTSPENNQKIALTLGKLPTDDNQVNCDSTINRRLTKDV